MKLSIGIINVSDRASRGVYPATPGEKARELLEGWIASPCAFISHVVPDEHDEITTLLKELADCHRCGLIVTTGGTGPAPRDITPEATEAVCEKLLPGFGERMRARSLEIVPTAILSRQTAGIRGNTLIVNLPGKPSAVTDCLEAVFPAIPYCLELIGAPSIDVREGTIEVFRPKSQ